MILESYNDYDTKIDSLINLVYYAFIHFNDLMMKSSCETRIP